MREFNSKNPELVTKQIIMTDHAYQRAYERLGFKDRNVALGEIRGMLRNAERIGNIISEDGNESVMYAYNRTAIILSTDLKKVITVKRRENITYEPLKYKVYQLHRKELRKLERLEQSKRKKLKEQKLKYAIELANLDYRKERTRSKNVIRYCTQRRKEIESILGALQKEIDQIVATKRQVANSLVSVL